MRGKFLCKLLKNEYDILIKNPHCIQYFCEIDRIITEKLSKQNSDYNYLYEKNFTNILKKSNIDLSKYTFKKDNIFKTTNQLPNLKLEYLERGQRPSTTMHLGQLKLFLANLQFLLYYAPKNKDVHVIYVGSGGRSRINFLTSLFPQCKLYLIDPIIKKNNMIDNKIFKNKNIVKIHKTIFTDKLVYKYKQDLKNKYTLIISDIRKETEESDIDDDNKLNMKWIKILKPNYAQVKWRIPRINKKYKYLDGKNYLQIYPGDASTETRLVIKGNQKLKYKIWDYEDEDNILYGYNRLIRPAYYKSNVKHKYTDHCHDCISMINLLQEYKIKYPENNFSKNSITNMISIMLNSIDNSEVRICNHRKNILKYLNKN